MIHTDGMTPHCALALIHLRDSTAGRFFMDEHGAADAQASLH